MLAALALGCGGAPPPPTTPPARAPSLGPLFTLVPPESTVVVLARPRELLGAPSTERVLTAMFPAEQLDRFSQRTGVDPRRLTELVLADHPDGRIVVARGPFDARFAVREAGERMAPLEAAVDRPWSRRAGFLGSRRVDLAALDRDVLVWVEGTPQLAAQVLAAAGHPPDDRRHALAQSGVAELRAAFDDAAFVLVAPHPLGLPRETGIGMLLARQRSLVAAAYAREDALRIVAELRGEFPPGAEDNVRSLLRSIAEADLGSVLGLRDALPTLRIEADDERLALRLDVDPGRLASGLRVLLGAELPELLGAAEPPP